MGSSILAYPKKMQRFFKIALSEKSKFGNWLGMSPSMRMVKKVSNTSMTTMALVMRGTRRAPQTPKVKLMPPSPPPPSVCWEPPPPPSPWMMTLPLSIWTKIAMKPMLILTGFTMGLHTNTTPQACVGQIKHRGSERSAIERSKHFWHVVGIGER